ncbi:DNA primase [Streptomyces viridosporus]|uniref:DNA primase n=1 Tax=Streptomyces viridosporus TaxID=67581 RepID=UPI003700CE0A
MNRTGLGLAIGAGYLLGRTKKLKAALAVGSLVAGKKLNLSPRMVADLVSQQLRDNPQFKEIGDQLRGDLRGVGKAASGALVERQLGSLADRLHGRTADVRGRLADVGGQKGAKDSESPEDTEDTEEEDRAPQDEPDEEEPAEEKAPPKEAAKKAPAKKATGKKGAQAKKAPPAKKAAAKTTAAKKTAASRGTRSRTQKGGGEG